MTMISKFNEFSIHKICREYGIKNYTINNGLVDVDVNVNLSNLQLDKLPLNFGKVSGSFYCGNNNLSSLESAPKVVGGIFYCPLNNLTTLHGCPKEVGADFNCGYNNLTTLQGSPKEVGGDFYCEYNNLTSLKGASQEIGGIFYYKSNPLPEEILDFKDIKYILKWQDDYSIWRDDKLDLFRFGELVKDYQKDIIKENNTHQYFYKITSNEYANLDQIININPKAIDIIKSKFKHSRAITTKIEHSGDNEFIAIYAYDRCVMTIVEIPDEWFIVSMIENKYYKCDQIEGLKKFIKSQ